MSSIPIIYGINFDMIYILYSFSYA